MPAREDRTAGGTSLWLDGPRPEPWADPVPAQVDLAIVGGGVAGIATAYHASALGLGCVVLERDRLAARASGRNDGQVLLGLGEHLNRIVGQWGRRRGLALWRFLDENHRRLSALVADAGLACDFVQEGGLRLAETVNEAAELAASARIMAAEGIGHRLLDAAGVRDAVPAARGFCGGLFLEREALFDPAAFVRALAGRARAQGAAIHEGAAVRRIAGGLGDFVLSLGDGGETRARVVLHATAALAPGLDRSGFLGRVVFPFRGQLLATAELPDALLAGIPRWAMSSHFCYEYFRRHGRRMTLGGMRWAVPGEENGVDDDTRIRPEVAAGLRAYLASHFPEVAACGVDREWTGIMAGTPDGLPLVGELPGRPGEYACLGFNGYGMSFAFLAGLCIAQMVTEGRTSFEAAGMLRPDRF